MPRSASGRRLLLLAVWAAAAAALSAEPQREQQAAARGARRLQEPALALRGTEPVAMQKHRLLGGRRHFYGRGCALVDVDGDGQDDIWLANGDNLAAQQLFGVEDCASHLYLGRNASELSFTNVPAHNSQQRNPGGWDVEQAVAISEAMRKEFDKEYLQSLGFTKLKSIAKSVAAERGIKGITKGGKAAMIDRLVALGQEMARERAETPTGPPLGITSAQTTSQWGQVFFDMDNDGDQDLVILNGGYEAPYPLGLFENVGGSGEGDHGGLFRDITEPAGLAAETFRQFWWGGAAADYDSDGLLDLVLLPLNGMENYVLHIEGRGAPPDPTFTLPRQRVFLLHNQGNGFVEESEETGVVIGSLELGGDAGISETKNPVWFDLDNDGDQDLYIAGSPHFLFRNEGLDADGAFRGFSDVTHGHIRHPGHADKLVFAASAADFDQDGQEDLFLGCERDTIPPLSVRSRSLANPRSVDRLEQRRF